MAAAANEQLLQAFYGAFVEGDGEKMASFYAAEAEFNDTLFKGLSGEEVGAMWRMLTKSEAKVEFKDVEADENSGRVHWEAWYNINGRDVHNIVEATFEFKDGKIIKHTDEFPFYPWARQALGVPGLLLGWTGFMRNKVKANVKARLDKFIAKEKNAH
mmetsp:Transcript_21626/g.40410  ORF Transcript_21626/g.40410 Transcript_21626/m.40410 type:complete len:158 (-) Transcript_21626:110-583(-)